MTEEADLSPILNPLTTLQSRGSASTTCSVIGCNLMLAALQRDDDQYLDILDDYDRGRDHDHGERPADRFSVAFGELIAADGRLQSGRPRDGVRGVRDAERRLRPALHPSQCAAGMAEMLTTGEEPDPPVTIADPACGSGRMLVLAARQHDVPTICVGQDEDPLCRLNELDIDRSAAPSDATAPSYQQQMRSRTLSPRMLWSSGGAYSVPFLYIALKACPHLSARSTVARGADSSGPPQP